MTIFVIDTSVFVSAAIRDRQPEQAIIRILESEDSIWVATDEIISEYRSVLSRPKFALPPEILERWSRLLDAMVFRVNSDDTAIHIRDPKDARFVDCAITTQADFILTGDRDFEGVDFPVTKVISVSQFLRHELDQASHPAVE